MKVLHIASYYQGSKVYKNLFSNLDVKSNVFVAVKTKDSSISQPNVLMISCLNVFTRLFYSLKIITLFLSFYNAFISIKKRGIDVIHAHTLYADGVLGYIFSLLSGTELVITIRTTDVDYGFNYYRHYKWLVMKVMRRTKKIVFISPAHRLKFIKYIGNEFNYKIEVIPNGIDDYYINTSVKERVYSSDSVIGLCIAAFNKNKNLKNTISAFYKATHKTYNAKLYIVGGTYQEYVDVYGLLSPELMSSVTFLGVLSKTEIIDLMHMTSFFIMVSHSETFGLVYIEAISQCLPIIYTKGQGVDGYFKDGEVGYKADSRDIDSIALAIKKVQSVFPFGLGPFIENPVKKFDWKRIANIYKEKVYK